MSIRFRGSDTRNNPLKGEKTMYYMGVIALFFPIRTDDSKLD